MIKSPAWTNGAADADHVRVPAAEVPEELVETRQEEEGGKQEERTT